jgi:hypothetical protein
VRSRGDAHTCGGRTAANAGRCRIRWLLYLTVVVASATTPLSAKRKDDILVLVNGDRLVGEIREVAQGETGTADPRWLSDGHWSFLYHEFSSSYRFPQAMSSFMNSMLFQSIATSSLGFREYHAGDSAPKHIVHLLCRRSVSIEARNDCSLSRTRTRARDE